MRGEDRRTGSLFSYVDLEARVRKDHPLRAIRLLVNEALAALASEFAARYAPIGRPSIPAEKLLWAMLLQAFLFDPLGAPVDGAAGVRPSVPLVRGIWDRRRGLGPFRVLEEPRPSARRRDRREVPERDPGAAARETTFKRGALLGRRHVD